MNTSGEIASVIELSFSTCNNLLLADGSPWNDNQYFINIKNNDQKSSELQPEIRNKHYCPVINKVPCTANTCAQLKRSHKTRDTVSLCLRAIQLITDNDSLYYKYTQYCHDSQTDHKCKKKWQDGALKVRQREWITNKLLPPLVSINWNHIKLSAGDNDSRQMEELMAMKNIVELAWV